MCKTREIKAVPCMFLASVVSGGSAPDTVLELPRIRF